MFTAEQKRAVKIKLYREKFDIAVSRAVARLNVLCEYCLPYVKVGGLFVAMKGPNADEELDGAENALKLLGGKVEKVHKFNLPCDEGERTIIVIKKGKTYTKTIPENFGQNKSHNRCDKYRQLFLINYHFVVKLLKKLLTKRQQPHRVYVIIIAQGQPLMLTNIEAMRLNFMLKNDNKVLEIPIIKIRPNKAQPRKTFDETELAALSASISENGILQPLSVRKNLGCGV